MILEFIKENYEECDGWGCTASSFRKAYFRWAGIGKGRTKFYAELRSLGIVVEKGTGGFIRLYGFKEKTV